MILQILSILSNYQILPIFTPNNIRPCNTGPNFYSSC